MVQGGHLTALFPFLVTVLFITEQTCTHHSVGIANHSVDCVFGFCSSIVQNQNLSGWIWTLRTLSYDLCNISVIKDICSSYMTFVILQLCYRLLNPGTDRWRLHWLMLSSWLVEAMTIMIFIYRWVLNMCEMYYWDTMELFYAIVMVVHAFISSDFHCKRKVYFENICEQNTNEWVFDLKELNYKSLLLKIDISRGM